MCFMVFSRCVWIHCRKFFPGATEIMLARRKNFRHGWAMKTASEIIDYVGGDSAVADAIGVGQDAVRKARKSGTLPSAWLDALEGLARRPLPREAFSFRRAPTQTAESSHPPAPSR
jgi:hypothetical protein